MEIYLVGGAVRDELLGKEVKDCDYVVVGATDQQMLDLGYKRVGADFPVYIHPESGDEYALARRERSTGPGYNDFEVEFGTDVTLEEDLYRRDLTMNAIAKNLETGEIIDPYNGREHMAANVIELVNPDAFNEDPVRVLRALRFAARYNMEVSEQTAFAIWKAVKNNSLLGLTRERIWKEVEKTLEERTFSEFMKLASVHNITDHVFRIPSKGLGLSRIEARRNRGNSKQVQFAAFCFHIGRHLENFLESMTVPSDYKKLARVLHKHFDTIEYREAHHHLRLLTDLQAFNTDVYFDYMNEFLLSSYTEGKTYVKRFKRVLKECKLVTADKFDLPPGRELGQAIKAKRESICLS